MAEELIKKEDFEKLYRKLDAYKRAYKEQKRACGHLACTIDSLIHELDNCVNIITNHVEEQEIVEYKEFGFPDVIIGDEIEFENGEKRIVLDNNITLDKNGRTRNWITKGMKYKIISHVNINGIFGRNKV